MWEWNSKVEPSAGAQYYGNFNFGSSTNNPLDTDYGYANALLGVYQTYTEATNRAVPNAHFAELDWYVQDNWRIAKRPDHRLRPALCPWESGDRQLQERTPTSIRSFGTRRRLPCCTSKDRWEANRRP